MKKTVFLIFAAMTAFSLTSSGPDNRQTVNKAAPFKWQTEQFADLRILRYKVPGFESLSLQQKELVDFPHAGNAFREGYHL